ncbi:unnamed protein product [Amaranthus hypochondriacus]
MANFQAKIKFSILLIVLLSPIILSLAFDQEENDDDSLVTSLFNSWNKVKSFVQHAQNKYFPPNLDFRMLTKDGGKVEDEHTSERIKNAAKKSLEEGEATMEKTAESAATVMEHAVHKAKDKVEEKLSHQHGHVADEL